MLYQFILALIEREEIKKSKGGAAFKKNGGVNSER